jgi:DNA modification methylase
MNQIEILNGNCLDRLSSIQPRSVDLVIADPPYNLGKAYGNDSDLLGRDEYLLFTKDWLTLAHRALKPTGTIYVFMGFQFISYVYNILSADLGMHFNSWICWHYTQGMGRKRGFSPRHDDILMFNASDDFTFNLDAIRVPQKYFRQRNNMRGANPGDVWEFSHVHYCSEDRQPHPTQKPEALMERMVLASSNFADLVVDPFLGSGTTARVCRLLGRRCIGIELNPEYIEIAKARLQAPFEGFDSVDPRMERVPCDLRDEKIRREYLANHEQWFLGNHQNAVTKFEESVTRQYGPKKMPGEHQRRLDW